MREEIEEVVQKYNVRHIVFKKVVNQLEKRTEVKQGHTDPQGQQEIKHEDSGDVKINDPGQP